MGNKVETGLNRFGEGGYESVTIEKNYTRFMTLPALGLTGVLRGLCETGIETVIKPGEDRPADQAVKERPGQPDDAADRGE